MMKWWLMRLKATPRVILAAIIIETLIAVVVAVYIATGGS